MHIVDIMTTICYNIIKEKTRSAAAAAESESVMKKIYNVEYYNEQGRWQLKSFTNKAAALKFAKQQPQWYMISTDQGDIIADNSRVIAMQNQLNELLSIR